MEWIVQFICFSRGFVYPVSLDVVLIRPTHNPFFAFELESGATFLAFQVCQASTFAQLNGLTHPIVLHRAAQGRAF
jgi:hypothetical protein